MSGDVATLAPQQVQTTANDTSALVSMIERAARDPSVDIDKMERLFQMHERIDAQRARAAFDAAFAAMQPMLPEIDKRGKIIIKEKGTEKVVQSTPYALWDDTNKMIKPILAQFGFGLSFRIAQTESRITTRAVLSHSGGHREETEFSASIDATGSKNNVQGWGSSFSYGKRYTGTAILNITTKGEDDDGHKAGETDQSKFATVEDIAKMITEAKLEEAWFLNHYSVAELADLNGQQRNEIKTKLAVKIAHARRSNASA